LNFKQPFITDLEMAPTILNLVTGTILALLLNANPSHELRILGLFPLHGRSHFIICEALMRNLAKQGHQVDVYSHFPLREPIPNYTDYSLEGLTGSLSNNMSYAPFDVKTNLFSLQELMVMYGEPICELINLPVFQKLMHEPPNNPGYDLVIIEVSTYSLLLKSSPFYSPFLAQLFAAQCYLAWGHRLQVPTVAVVTTTLYDWLNEPFGNPSNPAVEPSILSGFTSSMTFSQRVYNVLLGVYVRFAFNYYLGRQDKIVERLFGPNYPTLHELQKNISLVLVNYHYSINGPRSSMPMIQDVAGLHIEESKDQLSQVRTLSKNNIGTSNSI
jgi:glucuronosyltransferase